MTDSWSNDVAMNKHGDDESKGLEAQGALVPREKLRGTEIANIAIKSGNHGNILSVLI